MFHEQLEHLVAIQVHSVPEFGAPVVQVIDRVEIQVLLMPPEHGLPATNIYVGGVHPRYLVSPKAFAKWIN